MNNNLNDIWKSEVGRFRPEQAVFSPAELLLELLEKLAGLINSVLSRFNFDNGVTAEHLKQAGIVILVILFLVLVYNVYRRRHNLFRKRTGRPGRVRVEPARLHYARYVSSGDYAAALRFLVRLTADSARGMARTFSELFRRNEPGGRNECAGIYGEMLHCNNAVERTDLEKCENLVSVSYPDVYKKIHRKKRS